MVTQRAHLVKLTVHSILLEYIRSNRNAILAVKGSTVTDPFAPSSVRRLDVSPLPRDVSRPGCIQRFLGVAYSVKRKHHRLDVLTFNYSCHMLN